MNVIRNIRYDVFISFHGDETFQYNGRSFTTRDVLRIAVNEKIQERTNDSGISPSIFFDENHVRREIKEDIFRSLLQTRGRGLGLCLLTPEYFRAPWCLTELRSLQHLRQTHSKYLELRYLAIGCTAEQILNDPFVSMVVPNVERIVIGYIGNMTSKGVLASRIAGKIWDALSDATIRTIDVCGATRRQSFDQLRRLFGMADVGGLRRVFQLPPDPYANVDVTFDQAIASGILDEINTSILREAILHLGPHARERRLNALSAYEDKWKTSNDEMDWTEDAMDELEQIYKEVQNRIDHANQTMEQEVNLI